MRTDQFEKSSKHETFSERKLGGGARFAHLRMVSARSSRERILYEIQGGKMKVVYFLLEWWDCRGNYQRLDWVI